MNLKHKVNIDDYETDLSRRLSMIENGDSFNYSNGKQDKAEDNHSAQNQKSGENNSGEGNLISSIN